MTETTGAFAPGGENSFALQSDNCLYFKQISSGFIQPALRFDRRLINRNAQRADTQPLPNRKEVVH